MQAPDEAVPEMVRRLVADGLDVRAVVPAPEQGLEDFFLELTESGDVGSGAPTGKRRLFGIPGWEAAMSASGEAAASDPCAARRPSCWLRSAPTSAPPGCSSCRSSSPSALYLSDHHGGQREAPTRLSSCCAPSPTDCTCRWRRSPSCSVFLLPLAAAMVGGNMIAGEAEHGTLRTVLVRPVDRGALLLAKWATAVIYLGIVLLLVAAAGLISGWVFFGIRPMLIIGGTVGVAARAVAHLPGLPDGAGGLTCVLSLALLFSVITNSSLAAAVLTMVIILVVQILLQFSYFAGCGPTGSSTTSTPGSACSGAGGLRRHPRRAARVRRLHGGRHGAGVARVPAPRILS